MTSGVLTGGDVSGTFAWFVCYVHATVPNTAYLSSVSGDVVHIIVWEFRAKPGYESAFERVYGSEGEWAQLSRGARGTSGRNSCAMSGNGGATSRSTGGPRRAPSRPSGGNGPGSIERSTSGVGSWWSRRRRWGVSPMPASPGGTGASRPALGLSVRAAHCSSVERGRRVGVKIGNGWGRFWSSSLRLTKLGPCPYEGADECGVLAASSLHPYSHRCGFRPKGRFRAAACRNVREGDQSRKRSFQSRRWPERMNPSTLPVLLAPTPQ